MFNSQCLISDQAWGNDTKDERAPDLNTPNLGSSRLKSSVLTLDPAYRATHIIAIANRQPPAKTLLPTNGAFVYDCRTS